MWFADLADFAMRRRRAVLVAILLLTLAGGLAGGTVFGKLEAGGFEDEGAESGRAARVLEEDFRQGRPNLTLVVTAERGVDDPAATAVGTDVARRLAAEPGVVDVVSYWTSGRAPQLRGKDGTKALILGRIPGGQTEAGARVSELTSRYTLDRDGVRVQVGGYAAVNHEMAAQSERDARLGEALVFPVLLVGLVLVFGSVVAASLPLIVGLVTTLLSMGLMWLLALTTDLSVFAMNVVTLLGLGLAIDYSLLMLNRYREELAAGRDRGEAIRLMMLSAGRTVLFSAVTVAVALAGMAWFPLQALRSMAYGGVLASLLAAAVSLTALPALLAALGPRVERGRILRRPAARHGAPERGFWHRLASFVMRRPIPVATAAVMVLLLLGAPFAGLRLGFPDERVLPASADVRQIAEQTRTEFDAGELNALQVVLPRVDGGHAAVAEYAMRLSQLDNVARVDTVTGSYARGAQAAPATADSGRFAARSGVYLSVVPVSAETDAAEDLVRDLRATEAPAPALVTGAAAVGLDATDSLHARLPVAAASVAVAMVVLLFLLTGSLLLPFLALTLSVLGLTATFGALVWIFQDGHLSWLLGDFTVTGTIASSVPVMLFAIAFGLGMDYQVFMLSRIREEHERGGEPTAAVAMGLERIGRIVTAAAVLISVVFLAFLVSDITFMKAFGIGLPLAVLMDATLVRGALLPATMRLCGRAAWWTPGPLRTLHGRFGLREDLTEQPRPSETTVPVTVNRGP